MKYKQASSRIARRNKIRNFLSLFFNLFLFLLFFGTIFFFLRADFLKIKEVEIFGNKEINKEEILAFANSFLEGNFWFFIPKSNILFVKEKNLSLDLKNNFSRISEVYVGTKVSGILEINIEEREGKYVWCGGNEECYLMDKDGLLFEEVVGDLDPKILFKGWLADDPFMKNFYNQEFMATLSQVFDIFEKNNIKVFGVIYKDPNKIILDTNIGDVFINPEDDIIYSAQNVILLVEDLKKDKEQIKFLYIDARFNKKMFYKILSPI